MASTLPTSHLAATISSATSPRLHNVTPRSLPSPIPYGHLAIRITATAMNPVDWKMLQPPYSAALKTYPAVLGSDAAGEVVGVGVSDVLTSPFNSEFKVGDRVFFQGIIGNYDSSTFQQYCVIPSSLVARTPAAVSDDQAAGVSLASIAVVTGFFDTTGRGLTAPYPWEKKNSGGLSPMCGKGKSIMILGGASSVGQFAIQMAANLCGYQRVVTTASKGRNEGMLKALDKTTQERGNVIVVVDREQAKPEQIVALAEEGGLELDFVFDAISLPETQKLGVQVLQHISAASEDRKVGRVLITVLGVDDEAEKLGKEGDGERKREVEIKLVVGFGSAPHLRCLTEPFMKAVGGEDGWMARGLYMPNKTRVVDGGLGAVDEALRINIEGVSGENW